MKTRKRGLVSRFIGLIVRLAVFCAVVIALIFAGCDWYFTRYHPIHPRLDAAVAEVIQAHHIQPLTYGQIPPFYWEAVVATEDRRFASDPGIDLVGIARSIVTDIQQDGYIEGGSTITQQLVDNTILNQNKTLDRKAKQALYAIGIYDSVSKSEVFADYANVIYFGNNAWGLAQAAQTYFARTPGELNEGELAMLAGLPNAPTAYNPFVHFNLAKERQSIVIENMVDAGYITKQQAHIIAGMPIRLKAHG